MAQASPIEPQDGPRDRPPNRRGRSKVSPGSPTEVSNMLTNFTFEAFGPTVALAVLREGAERAEESAKEAWGPPPDISRTLQDT